jgi:hypothetical protein
LGAVPQIDLTSLMSEQFGPIQPKRPLMDERVVLELLQRCRKKETIALVFDYLRRQKESRSDESCPFLPKWNTAFNNILLIIAENLLSDFEVLYWTTHSLTFTFLK